MQNNITEKAILCTTNESVNKFNSICIEEFPGNKQIENIVSFLNTYL